MDLKDIREHNFKSIPTDPGVYKFYNKNSLLIYVGKAKNLKKRVSSYFSLSKTSSRKTQTLVKEIANIKFSIVNSEFDALLLENNLIKENQPKYNILLKDDKSFPFICISNERFPKVFSTRRYNIKKGEFFGPYTNVKAMNSVLDLLRKLYKIRTCSLSLTPSNIENKKFKICLEYHIGNCLGPCEGLQTESSYLDEIEQCRHILKGNISIVLSYFKSKMKEAAETLEFEQANSYKSKLDLLEKFQAKSVIVNKKLKNTDIFSVLSEKSKAIVNYMRIDNGYINISDTFTINKKLEETDEEILPLIIVNTQQKYKSSNRLIICNRKLENWDENVRVVNPIRGDKKTLLDLSLKNVLIFKKELLRQKGEKETNWQRILKQMQQDLKLKALPAHIECFDNSNIQGTNPVASMVCFKNAKPSKKDYRHFKIKTVIGPDDFGSMKEIVTRRYSRLINENIPLPNLIIVDGGKGQLNVAVEALKELDIYNSVPIIGIAKRLEEIYYPEDTIPLHLSKKSESLKLIQQLRDEAHRFAITFHRDLRSKNAHQSILDEISGLGSKTKQKLLTKYRTLNKIKDAAQEELEELIGKSKTQSLLEGIKKVPIAQDS
ncbi:excinuclease ABC subunit UvrC [Reichenbachiella sp. MALMAid0571]|uniref:excinuclease ABC subunit UvrC n=1 Tax=Reichenbachiella sp. MALMAid0571 TaxID=3143939 RepID=UPI0032DE6FAD